jgi:hypothetical protein
MGFGDRRELPDRTAAGTSSVGGDGQRDDNRRHARRIGVQLAATAAVLAGGALLASAATWSNLNATATNPTNSFLAGTVKIASNSSSSAVVSLTNAKPGAVSTGCIQVTYTGTLPSTVKLYGTSGGTGLNAYLTLVVTRGTFSGTPASGSSTGFTADTTNYISLGAGIMYSGTLAAWPTTAATANVDATSASPQTWNAGESHGCQFQVTLGSSTAAQRLTGTETFTFEANNN